MDKPFKNIKVQFVITSCLLSSVYSVSLFGVGLTAPGKVVKTGIGEISQVFKPNKPQYTKFPFGEKNQFSNDNNDSNQNGDFFNPPAAGTLETIKPQQPTKINKLSQENNQFSDIRIPNKDNGLFNSEKVPETLPVETNENTGNSEQGSEVSEGITLAWSDTGTDYTTETTDYETTTNELVNRIGGPPPAVVASLLG